MRLQRMRTKEIAVLLAFALALSWRTTRQVRVWDTNYSLWLHAVMVTPEQPRPWANVGAELEKWGYHEESKYADVMALRANVTWPGDLPSKQFNAARIVSNLAKTVASQGDLSQAVSLWRRVLETDDSFPDARFNLGQYAEMTGDLTTACTDYRIAATRYPTFTVPAKCHGL